MTRHVPHIIRFGVVAFIGLLLAVPSFADSQVRIVRLSSIEGDVQIDRNTGQGFEKAFLNLPVTQGVKLQTGSDGRAEVEFEDGGTLRIAPATVIEFQQLSLRDSGAKISAVRVQQGTAYVNFRGQKDDEFTVNFGREIATVAASARFRVQMNDTDTTLAVFSGNVKVDGASGSVAVGKKQSVTFDLANHDRYTLAKNVEEAPFDDWDKQQGQYHERYLSQSSYRDYSPYAYGASDLTYYGNFFNAPGYGRLWQPYFADVGWDPFMNGAWAWYPGYGYTWVSAYPWGWTPFHSGSWLFVPGYGWAWQPGGPWLGWTQFPRMINPPPRYTRPQPPASPGRGTIVMTPRPITVVSGVGARKMVIENNTAGLGIQRGSIRNMAKVSQAVKQSGSVTMRINAAPVRTPVSPSSKISRGTPARTATPPSPSVGSRVGTPAPRSTSAPRTATPRGATRK